MAGIYQLRASDNYPYFEALANLCVGWLIPGQLDLTKFRTGLDKLIQKRPYLAGQLRKNKFGLYLQVNETDRIGFAYESRNIEMKSLFHHDRPNVITTYNLNKRVVSETIIPNSKDLTFQSLLCSSEPIFKVHIVQCNDGFKLGIQMCHNLADGVGWGVVLAELKTAIDGKDIGPAIAPTGEYDPFVEDPLVKQLNFHPGKHNVAHTGWGANYFNLSLLGGKVAYDVYWHQRQLVELYIPISILRNWQAETKKRHPGVIVSRHDVITSYLWKLRAIEARPSTPCYAFWVADFRGYKGLPGLDVPKDSACNCVIENLVPARLAKDILATSIYDLALDVRKTTEKYREPEIVRTALCTMLESGRQGTIYMHFPSPLSEVLYMTNWTKTGLCDLDLSSCVKGGGKSIRCMNNLSATVPVVINVDPDEAARIKISLRPSTIKSIHDNPEFLLDG